MNKSVRASKRDLLREKRRKAQLQRRIIIIALVVVGALAIAAVLIYPSLAPIGPMVTITPNPVFQPNGLSMGNPNAPVKVQEFADFQCPYCKQFDQTDETNFINSYIATGKVYFIYTPFSFIDQNVVGGNESHAAAEAAYCASDQGKFWEYHDLVYANQTGENVGDFTDKRLAAFAQSLNLNMSDFNNCYSSGKYKQQVLDDYNLAVKDNISQTPSFLVNGTTVATLSDLFTTIDSLLATPASQSGSTPTSTTQPTATP